MASVVSTVLLKVECVEHIKPPAASQSFEEALSCLDLMTLTGALDQDLAQQDPSSVAKALST